MPPAPPYTVLEGFRTLPVHALSPSKLPPYFRNPPTPYCPPTFPPIVLLLSTFPIGGSYPITSFSTSPVSVVGSRPSCYPLKASPGKYVALESFVARPSPPHTARLLESPFSTYGKLDSR